MKVKISPSRLCGEICAPPSKSYAHRLMICAALAEGESTIRGISESEDMLAKCEYLNEKTDYHGVCFATGTPVSNSMTVRP